MKSIKKAMFLLALLFVGNYSLNAASPRKGVVYSVAFYNVENLFDTIHDPNKNDLEYVIGGKRGWDYEKYTSKLNNITHVINDLATNTYSAKPAVVGLAEVENYRVLFDLILHRTLYGKYQYIHYEGEDKRGIDCALLYDPEQFMPLHTLLVPSKPFKGDTEHKTRGFLVVKGLLDKEEIFFIVNHWPSRGAESPVRVHAANQVRAITDSIYNENKHANIVVMGDLNDDPMDESVAVALGAKKEIKQVKKKGFYNPWWSILEDKGVGTLMYKGQWNLFDQIIVSRSLAKNKNGLKYVGAEVFARDYLFQTTGMYKGAPLRTFGGKDWLKGYSDHLPTMIYLTK